MALALAIALPLGIYLGHRGRGELFAVAAGNAGRALPELVLIALFVAFVGTGFDNVMLALMILAVPPILTNTFVGIRQVDRTAVEAARGMGMSERAIALRIELPLAAPTIMTGVRTSAINVIATAAIAPLASVDTLGRFILAPNVYGDAGRDRGGDPGRAARAFGRAVPRRVCRARSRQRASSCNARPHETA